MSTRNLCGFNLSRRIWLRPHLSIFTMCHQFCVFDLPKLTTKPTMATERVPKSRTVQLFIIKKNKDVMILLYSLLGLRLGFEFIIRFEIWNCFDNLGLVLDINFREIPDCRLWTGAFWMTWEFWEWDWEILIKIYCKLQCKLLYTFTNE